MKNENKCVFLLTNLSTLVLYIWVRLQSLHEESTIEVLSSAIRPGNIFQEQSLYLFWRIIDDEEEKSFYETDTKSRLSKSEFSDKLLNRLVAPDSAYEKKIKTF